MKDHPSCQIESRSLTHLMDLDAAGASPWSAADLAAILEHQLCAPLECDLCALAAGRAGQVEATGAAADPPISTFSELLQHPHPPVELLELTKRFAKACRNDPEGPLPDEIATAVYFMSIVAAMTKCGRRITGMDDASLRYSLRWALDQKWLDESSRELFRQGLAAMDRSA